MEADLSNATLVRANFGRARFDGAKLLGAKAGGTQFQQANLEAIRRNPVRLFRPVAMVLIGGQFCWPIPVCAVLLALPAPL